MVDAVVVLVVAVDANDEESTDPAVSSIYMDRDGCRVTIVKRTVMDDQSRKEPNLSDIG